MANDSLFAEDKLYKPFEFNEDVANVFDDMLNRSVPFYPYILKQISELVAYYNKKNNNDVIYDLGCSTGTLKPYLKKKMGQVNYVGYDNSEPMIQRASKHAEQLVQFYNKDICKIDSFDNASAIICNLVLQFIPLKERQRIIKLAYSELPKNGVLIVVEKVKHKDGSVQNVYAQGFVDLKMRHGYSEAEVKHKEQALKGVLIPETSQFYLDLFKAAGFSTQDIFFKWYNFVGFLVVK